MLFSRSKSFRKKNKHAWNCPDNLIILCYHWSRYVLKFCLLLLLFPKFCYLIEKEFYQSIKVWNYWTFIRSMIMISVNYTSPSLLFQLLWKEKKMLINQIVCAYTANVMAMTLQLVFYCGKMSFLLLASLWLEDVKLEILNQFLIWSYSKISQKNWGQID